MIGIDSAADSKAFTSFLTTDNVQGGRIGADGMAEAIAAKYGKAEGDVALITQLPGVGSLEARDKGFKEELAAKYPGLKLVADKVADGQATTGLNIMTDLITANPNLRGVFAANLILCQGASQAVAENKKADTIKLVASTPTTSRSASQGRDDRRLVVQDPYRMGYDGLRPRWPPRRARRSKPRRHRRQPDHQGQHGRREAARAAVPEARSDRMTAARRTLL